MTNHEHVFPRNLEGSRWSRDMTSLWHHTSWLRHHHHMFDTCGLHTDHACWSMRMLHSFMFFHILRCSILSLFAHVRLVYKHDMYHSKVPRTVLVLFQYSNLSSYFVFLSVLNSYLRVSWHTVADIRTVLLITSLFTPLCVESSPPTKTLSP